MGNRRVIGGLSQVVGAYDLPNNAIYQNALTAYNEKVIEDVNRLRAIGESVNVEPIRLNNLDIIRDGIVPANRFQGIKPERITSVEFGYRSLIEDRKIIEVVVYRNYYQNFLGVSRVVKPRVSPSTDLLLATEQASSPATSDLFYVTDNAEGRVVTQGLELLYDVTGETGTNFSINATFANMINDSNDPITPGFNTPPFKFNFTFGHRKISRNFGASISWRSRSEFRYESNFLDGDIPDYSTMDFQMTVKLPTLKSALRFGGNNVFNREQFNNFGGPEMSAYYYLSFTYDPFSFR